MERNYSAAIADATRKYPGPYYLMRFRSLDWEDATDKERYDSGYYWMPYSDLETYYCLIPLTEKERQEQIEAIKERILNIYLYLLENYGIEIAEKFTIEWENIIKEYNVEIIKYPYCRSHEGQCNLFCNFFKRGKCIFKDDETRPVQL